MAHTPEHRDRWVTETDSQGRTSSRQEHYTETVTDFDFSIDITPEHLMPLATNPHWDPANERYRPIHWSVGDDEPAYRGRMFREYEIWEDVDTSSSRRQPVRLAGNEGEATVKRRKKATRKEVKEYKAWLKRRAALGFPPWLTEQQEEASVDGSMYSTRGSLRSSKTLRQWADEYCQSPKYLKEFVYEKVLYGWNIQQLEQSIRTTIEGTPYDGEITITSTPYNSKIYIRPDNRVSRMLSNKWLMVLSIILFIYPFIWLFKRFHSRGGGRWEVCGGAYPLKQWEAVIPSEEEALLRDLHSRPQTPDPSTDSSDRQGSESLPPYNPWEGTSSALFRGSQPLLGATQPALSSRFKDGTLRYDFVNFSNGRMRLVGTKEGEWFRMWEGVIARAVQGRYQSRAPLPPPSRSTLTASALDGYVPPYSVAPALVRL